MLYWSTRIWLLQPIATCSDWCFPKTPVCCLTFHWLIFMRYAIWGLWKYACLTLIQRVCELCTIAVGGKIGYFTGDPLRLLEDAQILKPNFFPSVPRVLNRVYQAAMVGGNVPGLKGALFNKAVQTKLANLHQTGEVTHAFWDRLVFRKVRHIRIAASKILARIQFPQLDSSCSWWSH